MKKFIVLILALNMYLGVSAQFTPGDTLKYRISLKDKAATDYSDVYKRQVLAAADPELKIVDFKRFTLKAE